MSSPSRGEPSRRLPWRTIGLLAVVALVILTAVAVYVGSQPRLPAPFGVARNGLVAYSKGGDIFTLDPAGGTARPIVTGETIDLDPAWSLDGTRVAFVRQTGGGTLLVMADADGSHQFPAKTGPLVELNTVAWSPDGRSIAVTSNVNGRRTITMIDSTTGDAHVLDVGMSAEQVSWRPPDGRQLVFLGESAAGMGLYLIAPDGSGLREIVHAGSDTGLLPNDWSPDGRRLAFHRTEQIVPGMNVYRIHVLDVDTRAEVVVASSGGDRNSAGFGKWSPDGNRILFLDGGDDCNCNWLSVAPSAGGPSVRLTADHPAPYGIDYAWSPDGTMIYTAPASGGTEVLLDPASGPLQQQPAWITEGVSSWQRLAR